MKTKTTVRIAGKDYTMVGNDSEEHMHRVAVYVDRKMNELSVGAQLPPNMVPVLTAMNIADELLKSQDENTRLRNELMQAHQKMAQKRQQGAPEVAGAIRT